VGERRPVERQRHPRRPRQHVAEAGSSCQRVEPNTESFRRESWTSSTTAVAARCARFTKRLHRNATLPTRLS
jgi:hypothetical protein